MHQYGVHQTIIAHSINRTVRSASCSIVWNLWAVGSLSRLGAFVAGSVGSIDAHLFGLQRVVEDGDLALRSALPRTAAPLLGRHAVGGKAATAVGSPEPTTKGPFAFKGRDIFVGGEFDSPGA